MLMCKQMQAHPTKKGYYYKELSSVSQVAGLILLGLGNGKVRQRSI